MRKLIFSLTLSLSLLIALPLSALALDEREIYSTVINNTSSIGVLNTSVATTTIIPGQDRILGFTVCPNNAQSRENLIALYDGTDVNMALFGEVEAPTGESLTQFFPLARRLSNQLTVRQGAQTIVTIYYVRFIQ